jgi:hypothetical protein
VGESGGGRVREEEGKGEERVRRGEVDKGKRRGMRDETSCLILKPFLIYSFTRTFHLPHLVFLFFSSLLSIRYCVSTACVCALKLIV